MSIGSFPEVVIVVNTHAMRRLGLCVCENGAFGLWMFGSELLLCHKSERRRKQTEWKRPKVVWGGLSWKCRNGWGCSRCWNVKAWISEYEIVRCCRPGDSWDRFTNQPNSNFPHVCGPHEGFSSCVWPSRGDRKKENGFVICTSIQSRFSEPISLFSMFNSVQVWQLLFCRGIFWLNWIAWIVF